MTQRARSVEERAFCYHIKNILIRKCTLRMFLT